MNKPDTEGDVKLRALSAAAKTYSIVSVSNLLCYCTDASLYEAIVFDYRPAWQFQTIGIMKHVAPDAVYYVGYTWALHPAMAFASDDPIPQAGAQYLLPTFTEELQVAVCAMLSKAPTSIQTCQGR